MQKTKIYDIILYYKFLEVSKLKIIGLSGPSGSGKGALCSILADHGIPSIDADAVYHSLLIPPSPCLDAICECFGRSILKEDGTLNRPDLAKIVFAPGAEDKLSTLNKITHKFVVEKIHGLLNELSGNGVRAAVIDAPALFEAEIDKECDLVVCIIADKESRAKRIIKRDGISNDAAKQRINAQKPDDFYIQRSDFVIHNSGSLDELKEEAHKLIKLMEADQK